MPEPEWELGCRCLDCEYQRRLFGRTFEETQEIARRRIAAVKGEKRKRGL